MAPPQPLHDLARLCVHTITTKPWPLERAAEAYARAGVKGITVWRDAIAGQDPALAGAALRGQGLEVVSLCRGGFFPHREVGGRQKALDDNRTAIDEAAALGAPLVVLVCGAVPGQPLAVSRDQIRAGIEAVLPHAQANNVKLAIEPLHPMYADDRSAVNTLAQALDIAERFPADQVGVTVDTYHIWWDDTAPAAIARAGASGRIHTFQLADWITPLPQGVLTGRGQIGDGSIDMREWKSYVEAAGYTGPIEVELFNDELWAGDGRELLAQTAQRFVEHAV